MLIALSKHGSLIQLCVLGVLLLYPSVSNVTMVCGLVRLGHMP